MMGGGRVTITTDLIEDWIQIRSTLQRQIKMLESGQAGIASVDTKTTIIRLRTWVVDLNALLKEHALVDELSK